MSPSEKIEPSELDSWEAVDFLKTRSAWPP